MPRTRSSRQTPRRLVALGLFACAVCVGSWALLSSVRAQDQAPSRREFTIVAADGRFTPNQIEVRENDLVRLTLQSKDIAHSFAIDEYRIVRRIAAGGTTTFEFRADRAGTFRFYCNLTDGSHGPMQGELVVRQ